MASPSDPEEPVTKLKLAIRIRTSLYNKFFLLRLKLVINEQPAQLEADRNGCLTLNCGHPKVSVTYDFLLTYVNEILQQHGLHGVNSYWCDKVPMFELKISSYNDLKKLFRLEEKIQEDIASKIKAHMVKPKLTVSVKQSIYWLNSAGYQCRVTKENSPICLDLFSSSGCANTLQPTRQSSPDNGPPTMKDLDTELCEVIEWFRLGTKLEVEDHELRRIKKENQGDIAQCRLDMFSEWLKAGNNKWSDIVEALKNMGKVELAEKIAKKHGLIINYSLFGVEYAPEDATFHKKKPIHLTMEDIDEREMVIKQAMQEYKEEIIYCKEKIKCLQEAIEHLKQELEKALETEKHLQQELEKALETEKILQQELEKALKTEKNLQQELEKALETEKNLQQELEKALETEKYLQQELEKAKEENEQQKQELEAKQTENEQQKQELESKIEKFNYEYSILEMNLHMSEHRYKTKNEEMEILKEHNELLKAKIQDKMEGPTPGRTRHTSSSFKGTNSQPTGPRNEKEEGESLPEVINRGNAVSANKPRARGLQKKRFSLPEITTIPSDSYEKHQKSTSERASAASAVPQLKRPTTTHSFPTKPQSRQIPLPEIQPTARPSEMLNWRKKSVPQAIRRGTVAVNDDIIYFMGQGSTRVHKYHLSKDEWKELNRCPHINPGLVFIDGLLTAVGGQKGPYKSDTNEVVSLEKGKWVRKFPSMQQAHSDPIILVYKEWVIAIDRNDVNRIEVIRKVHSFASTWSTIELEFPLDLKNISATICGDNLILVNALGTGDCVIHCESLLTFIATTQSGPSQACRVADQSLQCHVFQSLSKETTITTFLGDAISVNEDGIYKLKLDKGRWLGMTSKSYTPVKGPIVCAVNDNLVVIGGVQEKHCTSTIQIGSV